MAIFIDQIVTHTIGTGDNTQPPGIGGAAWCHIISTVGDPELLGFMTAHFLTIGQDPSNIRTPAVGSLQTYYGLDADMRDQAILAGASPQRVQTVRVAGFDSPGGTGPFYEP